jgi:hypothetical protein
MYRTKKYSQLQAEVKRRKIENGEEVKLPIYATQFSKEEIDSEERRHQKRNLLFGAALFAVNLLFGELGRVDRQFDLFAMP